MNKHFPNIVDTGFTAGMERELDDVEEGRRSWTEFLHNFYGDFKETMKKAEAEMNRVQKPLEELEETCPDCGRNLVIRTGRFGRFISCSGFPECSYRRSVVNKTGALCPLCHGDLVERKTRQKKRVFYGCGNYPTCNFAIWDKPVPEPCPKCGGLMVVTRPGQDPVCYQEVIAPQRNAEAKPLQNGEQKTTHKKVARAKDELSNGTAARATRRVSTRKKVTGEEIGLDATPGNGTGKTTTKTAIPRTTTKRTPAATTVKATRQTSATAKKSIKKTSTTPKKATNSRTKTAQ